jgi:hypothetical protein
LHRRYEKRVTNSVRLRESVQKQRNSDQSGNFDLNYSKIGLWD